MSGPLMARSEALNVKSGRRGRIPQPVVSCSPQNLLARQQENRGRRQALKACLQLRIRRVIIRITRRILGLPLFLQLTSYRDLWPLQVLDRVRDPAPEAASQFARLRSYGKTYILTARNRLIHPAGLRRPVRFFRLPVPGIQCKVIIVFLISKGGIPC